jgi:5'-3' exonuclease
MAVYERYSQSIPDSLVYEVIDFLKYKNLEFIVAPYEADSQIAFLYQSGLVDFIISEDSDMIAYDCYRIVKGLKVNGKCDALYYTNESLTFLNHDDNIDDKSFFGYFMTLSSLISA